MISSIANLIYELSHEFPNNLRLRILRNKEILRKSQIWVETEPSAQSPYHKFNFGSSNQKICRSRYQTFLVLSSFTGFLNFVPNILPRIVEIWRSEKKTVWVLPNIWRLAQVMDTKFGTHVSSRILLKATKCQGLQNLPLLSY